MTLEFAKPEKLIHSMNTSPAKMSKLETNGTDSDYQSIFKNKLLKKKTSQKRIPRFNASDLQNLQ